MLETASVIAGRYRVERELGRGGMGTVYLAEQIGLGRRVALKVLNESLAGDPEFLARFAHEARTLAQLDHTGIVGLYDSGIAEGAAYIALEYVDAPGLDRVLRQRRLSVAEAGSIGAQIAEALQYAHHRGVVHRDVKPSNILLGTDGRAVLTDFGIARMSARTRLTQWGVKLGTPEYMSPEQVNGGEVDGRADLYSLGIVLYEMLSGRPPFTADTPMAVLGQHVFAPVPPLPGSVPPPMRETVEVCLRKDPSTRWMNAGQVAATLRGNPVPSGGISVSAPPRLSSPRVWVIPAAIGTGAVLLVGGIAVAAGLQARPTALAQSSVPPVVAADSLSRPSDASAAATATLSAAPPVTTDRSASPAQTSSPPTVQPTALTSGAAWAQVSSRLDHVWANDWPQAITLIDGFRSQFPNSPQDGIATTKLYAALVANGQDLMQSGKTTEGVAQLLRAQALVPDAGQADAALAALTPTTAPAAPPAPRAAGAAPRPAAPPLPAAAPAPRITPLPRSSFAPKY